MAVYATSGSEPPFEEVANVLRADGCFVWRHALATEDVDAHVAAYEAFAASNDVTLPRGFTQEQLEQFRATASFLKGNTTHAALSFHAPLLAFARRWFQDEPVLQHCATTLQSDGTHPRNDTLNSACVFPWTQSLRFWCALEDIHPLSGPLTMYPGTHVTIAGNLRERLFDERPDLAALFQRLLAAISDEGLAERREELRVWYRELTARLRQRLEETRSQPDTPTLQKGDVIVFNPGVIHRSDGERDTGRTRKSFIFTLNAQHAHWYGVRSFCGLRHDYRREENRIRFAIGWKNGGLRILDYLAVLAQDERRAVVTRV